MSLVIGLTGSIGTGKSTVSQMLKEHNIPVIDADVIAREVVKPGEPAYNQIVDAFGEEILLPGGEIDRKKLGEIVFGEEKKRKQLNGIVHPAVRERMLADRDRLADQKENVIVLDIPLLYESGLTHFVEKVIVVYVTEETQLKRLRERDGTSKEEALRRINSQLSIEEKSRMADKIIDNNGTLQETKQQVEQLLSCWDTPENDHFPH